MWNRDHLITEELKVGGSSPSLTTLVFAICLLAALHLMSCIEWTTNGQGQLQSVGVPGIPVWQNQTLAEQRRSLAVSPSSVVDAEAANLPAFPSDAAWLAEINGWRSRAGARPIGENSRLSQGATEHAEYLVRSGPKTTFAFVDYMHALGGAMHTEDRNSPYFTDEGYQAARTGNVAFKYGAANVVDDLVEAPFHRLSILAPWMRVAGYGDYGDCPIHAATLVIRGATPVGLTEGVLFPPDNGTVNGRMSDHEWPNPLAGCPGYSFPVGTPITVQMGAFVKVQLESYAIEDETESREVEACGFDAITYPIELGRLILVNYGAVVVIPRNALTPGHTYRVSIRTHRHAETWSFRVFRGTLPVRSAESPNHNKPVPRVLRA